MTENNILYTLVRSNRKTVTIYITKDAAVEVRAPLKMRKSDIEKIVASKEKWIRAHMQKRMSQIEKAAGFSLYYGDFICLLGKRYQILAFEEFEKNVDINDGSDKGCVRIAPGLSRQEVKHAVIKVYKSLARQVLKEKAEDFAQKMNVKPCAVKINSAKTRWGSCSGKNSINFSWRIIMADDEVIDYLVVHELAHIKEHNHSDRFWALVALFVPDYKKKEMKLKELQKRLSYESWE